MKAKVYRHIRVEGNWFLNHVKYRFQYSAYLNRRYLEEEGETIVYTTPEGVKHLKVNDKYQSLGALELEPHKIKAEAILVLKKRRKDKYFLKKEGKPLWDHSYKESPRSISLKRKKKNGRIKKS